MATLFRKLTNEKLVTVALSGEVLDLGGYKGADYHKLFGGKHKITTLNFTDENTDIVFDLERSPWPIGDAKFDAVLAVNLLEHIYHHRELLREAHRVLKPGGNIVVTVPFLHQVHPSPHDYFRYTRECLEMLLIDSGFSDIQIEEIGRGAFSAVHNQLERFTPSLINILKEKVAVLTDLALAKISALSGRKYDGSEYPLGYFARARK